MKKPKCIIFDFANTLETDAILNEMRRGCANLQFNKAVYEYSLTLKGTEIRTALVTNNIDLFTEVVAPFYKLDNACDVIVTSAD